MKYNKIIAAGLTISLLLSGCGEQEEAPVITETNTPVTAEAEIITTTAPPETEAATTTEAATEAETIPPITEAPGQIPDDYREEGRDGIKVIGRNGHYTGLMGCWGTFENCDRYAAAVNKAAAALPEVRVFNMVIPTASDFYVPDDITGFTASQKEKIDYISQNLENVVNVDAYSALSSHTDEYIYTRTDYHWQPLGGYYAAEAFVKAAGLDGFAPLSDYEEVTKEGFVGSLSYYCEILFDDPEPFTMYISPNDGNLTTTYYDTSFQNGVEADLFVSRDAGAYYCSFLGTDQLIAKIETDCTNGKTLVVMKESYGNALIPFLTQSYQNIYVCDVRYFDLNCMEFCRDVGADDLLFAVCTYTPAGPNIKSVETVVG
ncbi:MAG: DHHW family protein [Firmicutes bacterium]|nr:DHHW family protein [[Eubacterium] siraeum]MCM1486988.1 DHHW family protein [Bacillota bacterium]